MRPALGVGYLLCRAADSITDTDVVPPADRLKLLSRLSDLMGQFPIDAGKTTEFFEELQMVVVTPSSAEGRLLKQGKNIVTLLVSLSRTDQALVQEIVSQVIHGMKMDLEFFGVPSDKIIPLANQQQLESYLGWIGGDPGRFWTKVTLDHEPALQIKDPVAWREKGFSLGTGLQLVNILRDLAVDLKRGRCYIPSDLLRNYDLTAADLLEKEAHVRFLPLYHHLIEQAAQRLSKGIEYLHEIPPSFFRLRAAVWWPLAIGMETLGLLRNRYAVLDAAKTQKISRWDVWKVLGGSPVILSSNRILNNRFERMQERIR
jgi:farnesyl-diphosphate farnesyltransferase